MSHSSPHFPGIETRGPETAHFRLSTELGDGHGGACVTVLFAGWFSSPSGTPAPGPQGQVLRNDCAACAPCSRWSAARANRGRGRLREQRGHADLLQLLANLGHPWAFPAPSCVQPPPNTRAPPSPPLPPTPRGPRFLSSLPVSSRPQQNAHKRTAAGLILFVSQKETVWFLPSPLRIRFAFPARSILPRAVFASQKSGQGGERILNMSSLFSCLRKFTRVSVDSVRMISVPVPG